MRDPCILDCAECQNLLRNQKNTSERKRGEEEDIYSIAFDQFCRYDGDHRYDGGGFPRNPSGRNHGHAENEECRCWLPREKRDEQRSLHQELPGEELHIHTRYLLHDHTSQKGPPTAGLNCGIPAEAGAHRGVLRSERPLFSFLWMRGGMRSKCGEPSGSAKVTDDDTPSFHAMPACGDCWDDPGVPAAVHAENQIVDRRCKCQSFEFRRLSRAVFRSTPRNGMNNPRYVG